MAEEYTPLEKHSSCTRIALEIKFAEVHSTLPISHITQLLPKNTLKLILHSKIRVISL